MQDAPACRCIRPQPIPDGHPPCRKSRQAGHCAAPTVVQMRLQHGRKAKLSSPPSYLPGCVAPPGRRRPGRRAKAGSCWCPNQPRRIQPCSFQALPFSIRPDFRYPRPSPATRPFYIALSDQPLVPLHSARGPRPRLPDKRRFRGRTLRLPGRIKWPPSSTSRFPATPSPSFLRAGAEAGCWS